MLWRLKRRATLLFVDQLCVCLSGPWERARSLIMKCTRTCTKVCALSLRQPKRTEKPKWGKKWGRQGNWHVMWGNSYPIIPNNSLSQDTSSALILRNPPQLIPNRLAPILSFISCIFLLLTSRLFCPLQFFFKTKCLTEYLRITLQLFLQMSTLARVFERLHMCESAYTAFFFFLAVAWTSVCSCGKSEPTQGPKCCEPTEFLWSTHTTGYFYCIITMLLKPSSCPSPLQNCSFVTDCRSTS